MMDTSFLVGNAPTPLLNPLDVQAKKIAIQNALSAGALQQQSLQSGALALQQQARDVAADAQFRNMFAQPVSTTPAAAPAMGPAAGLPTGLDGSALPAAPAFGGAPAPAAAPAPAGPSLTAGSTAAHDIPDAQILAIFGQKGYGLIHARNEANNLAAQAADNAGKARTAAMNYWGSLAYGLNAVDYDQGAVQAALAKARADRMDTTPEYQLLAANANNPAALKELGAQAMANSPEQQTLLNERTTAGAKATDAKTTAARYTDEKLDKDTSALAGRLGAIKNQSDWIATLAAANPQAVARLNPPAAWSPAAAQTMLAKGSTPAEQVTATETARRDANTAANDRAARNQEQQRINLEQQKFSRQYGAAFGQLAPADQAIAQKVATGDFNPAQLSRMPNKEAILSGAIELNPGWSQQTYATKHAFEDPNSQQSKNLQTIARIVGHIGRFEDNSKAMGWSPVYGWAGVNLGGTASSLDEDSHAIAGELEKLVSGGVGSQTEIDAWKRDLRSSLASTRKTAVDEISQLVGSQYEGMAQAYRAGTGLELPVQKYLTPAAQKWMSDKGINIATSGAPSAAPAGAKPAAAPKQDLSKVSTADLLKALGQ